MNESWLKRLVTAAIVLALFVVVLGAYTRLTDAGLGCPDWPGCYGHMMLPNDANALKKAQMTFPGAPIEQGKALTEMTHRYAAGTLGLLIFFIAFLSVKKRLGGGKSSLKLSLLLLLVLVFQAALGMWTVTLKLLPIVVMGHLLGGMLLLSLLVCYRFSLHSTGSPLKTDTGLFPWFVLGIGVVFVQIALGGWVSSNYAGLACVGFPYCNGLMFPEMDFTQGFNLFTVAGANHQGGLLDSAARVTIQVVHRAGALVTACYVIGLAVKVLSSRHLILLRRLAGLSILLVVVQFSLGVINVVDLLPLPVAVAHNAVAALLLLCMVAMTTTYRHEVIHAK